MSLEAALAAPKPAKRHGDLSVLSSLRDAPDEMLLTTGEVAALTNYAPVTLRLWFREKRGPQRIYLEGFPRYRLGSVRAWIAAGEAA